MRASHDSTMEALENGYLEMAMFGVDFGQDSGFRQKFTVYPYRSRWMQKATAGLGSNKLAARFNRIAGNI